MIWPSTQSQFIKYTFQLLWRIQQKAVKFLWFNRFMIFNQLSSMSSPSAKSMSGAKNLCFFSAITLYTFIAQSGNLFSLSIFLTLNTYPNAPLPSSQIISYQLTVLFPFQDFPFLTLKTSLTITGRLGSCLSLSDDFFPKSGISSSSGISGSNYYSIKLNLNTSQIIIEISNKSIYLIKTHITMRQMQQQRPKQQQMWSLRNGNYYYLLNPNKKQALSIPKSTHYNKEDILLKQIDQNDINQIWMIEQVQTNRYEIVHAMSTLVLQNQGKSIRVHHGKWKQSQLFYLQKADPKNNPNHYYIKENKDSIKYLIYQQVLKVKEKKNTDSLCLNDKWQLKLIKNHKILDKTCIIESPHSSLVLDVPQASEKQSTSITQFICNKRFNQRWQIIKQEKTGFHYIKVFRNDLVLDVSGQSKKQGTHILQYHKHQQPKSHQLWLIQQQGKRLYFIRSALDLSLLMGVSGNSLKEGTEIVTTKTQSEAFWRIIGYVPI